MSEKLVVDVNFNDVNSVDKSDIESVGEDSGLPTILSTKSSGAIGKAIGVGMIINGLSNMLDYGISLYGDLTSNTLRQQDMRQAKSFLNTLMLGPVGIAKALYEEIPFAINNAIETRNKNYDVEILRQRAGNESFNNSKGVK